MIIWCLSAATRPSWWQHPSETRARSLSLLGKFFLLPYQHCYHASFFHYPIADVVRVAHSASSSRLSSAKPWGHMSPWKCKEVFTSPMPVTFTESCLWCGEQYIKTCTLPVTYRMPCLTERAWFLQKFLSSLSPIERKMHEVCHLVPKPNFFLTIKSLLKHLLLDMVILNVCCLYIMQESTSKSSQMLMELENAERKS